PAVQAYAIVRIDPVADLCVLCDVGKDAAVRHRGLDLGVESTVEQHLAHRLLQLRKALARGGAYGNRLPVAGAEDIQVGAVGDAIDLVERQQGRMLRKAQFVQHRLNGLDLFLRVGTGRVDDVQ